MKKQKYWYILFPALWVFLLTGFSSCGNMDDTYEQFLEGGSIIYVAKADSIKLRPGRNKVEISWLLLSDPKVKKYKIYWNNKLDSLENPVEKSDVIDTVRVEINDLSEGNHTFEIYTYDATGNRSVKAEISGRSYGEHYENSLLNTTISKYSRKGDDLKIIWNKNQPEGLSVIELEYMDTNNAIISKSTSNFSDTTTLAGFPLNGSFQYRSGFLPDSVAIDTFYAKFEQINTDL